MTTRIVGVIGGSGLYDMDGLVERSEHRVTTTFGDPSDVVIAGTLGDTRFLFLPRHGRGHRIPPHRINYRANLLALKQLGAEQVISISAVGSMQEDIHPGDVVLVDQFIDRTRSRPSTFFDDDGVVAHVEFADPIDAALQDALYRAALEVGVRARRGGTYVCIEGPQFSTRAESDLYRSWGTTVIGMTNLPEARLAREAELPYATVALVTDYDCWRREEAAVSVDAVLAVLKKNVGTAQALLRAVSPKIPDPATSPATNALRHALITPPSHISAAAKEKLAALIGRHLS
ncbi:S-methyl-5'-thioadenosine phosphorylase [Sandaracinus amylolyticus]|uniref:S-methyl-5'-thioadenosine phosphorylase n=1 Tax=Sandaracinus amylolyticus TaxID=927083 RepID=UPI001F00A2BF|nr:S-methyl-5'-thioadenosine phosphorylase [Sandaracinus amylolyticus]UJR81784.1 S-methyl-5'-thioadenosine phosphorylase [Sandaracinus amylolyticus]